MAKASSQKSSGPFCVNFGIENSLPYILTLAAAEDGGDDPSDLLNTLPGLPAEGKWLSGDQFTIGQ
jgi:hypothetical protein